MIKKILKLFLPPIFEALYKKTKPTAALRKPYFFKGNFLSWHSAAAATGGYDQNLIFEKVKQAALTVKQGKAVFERDSVLFHQKQYSWPLLACLEKAWADVGCRALIDFGGALGSSFFQHRHFFGKNQLLNWGVVEQPHFVEFGKKEIAGDELFFAHTIADCFTEKPLIAHNTVFFSSCTMQYLPDAEDFIKEIQGYGFPYLLLDRIALNASGNHLLKTQYVSADIYEASYPARFFDEQKLIASFFGKYELLESFDSYCDSPMLTEEGEQIYWKGFFFKRKKEC